MDWHFGKNNGREGFTATAMTYFAGGRLVQTVRETIQNSLDAANGNHGPVKIAFSLDDIPYRKFQVFRNWVGFCN